MQAVTSIFDELNELIQYRQLPASGDPYGTKSSMLINLPDKFPGVRLIERSLYFYDFPTTRFAPERTSYRKQ